MALSSAPDDSLGALTTEKDRSVPPPEFMVAFSSLDPQKPSESPVEQRSEAFQSAFALAKGATSASANTVGSISFFMTKIPE